MSDYGTNLDDYLAPPNPEKVRELITNELRKLLPPGTEIGGALGYMVDQFTVQVERAHRELRISLNMIRLSEATELIIPLNLSASTEPNYAAEGMETWDGSRESWAQLFQGQFQASPESDSSYAISRIAQIQQERINEYRALYMGVDHAEGPDHMAFFATTGSAMRRGEVRVPELPITATPRFSPEEILAHEPRVGRSWDERRHARIVGFSTPFGTRALDIRYLRPADITPIVPKKWPSDDPIIRAVINAKIERTTKTIAYISDEPPVSAWERLRANYKLLE